MLRKIFLFLAFALVIIVNAQNPIITKWNTNILNDDSKEIKIFALGAFNYNYQSTTNSSIKGSGSGLNNTTIVMPEAGIYVVKITPSGQFKLGGTDSPGDDAKKLIELSQWGTVNWYSNLGYMFDGCTNLKITATDIPDFSGVTDFFAMFRKCQSLDTVPNMNSWNTSNVLYMDQMFNGAINFNGNISNWNTSKVKSMNSLFYGAQKFNQNISTWSTLNVTDMDQMFNSAFEFNQNLNSWNTSKVTSMRAMFNKARNFNGAIGNWDTSQVIDMSSMFLGAKAFNQNIANWNTGNVTTMVDMFAATDSFNQYIGDWDTSKVTDMSYMFNNAIAFNQNLNWNTSNVTSMMLMFLGAKSFNGNISGWNTSKITKMNQLFQDAVVFNQNIGNWDTSNVTDMSSMFSGTYKFNQNISNWNTAKVTSMYSMFAGASAFNQNLNNWNVSNVVNMSYMFFNSTAFNQNIGSWNWQYNPAVDMGNMLDISGLSCENYSKTLKSWAQNSAMPINKSLGANNLKYGSEGQIYRNQLITNKGWTIEDDIFDVTCTVNLATDDINSNKKSINIYPNPTSDKVYIKSYQKVKEVTVYNINSQIVFKQMSITEVDLRKLPSGIYMMKIVESDGKISTHKIVKK